MVNKINKGDKRGLGYSSMPTALIHFCVVFGVISLLASCAYIPPDKRNGPSFAIDYTALFGTVVDTFKLQDGSDGALREGSSGFSIRISKYFRVFPLENAIAARIMRVDYFGDRTVLTIKTQEKYCRLRYILIDVRGSSVQGWAYGNCEDQPNITLDAANNNLIYDFPHNRNIERFIYDNGGFYRKIVPQSQAMNSKIKLNTSTLSTPAGTSKQEISQTTDKPGLRKNRNRKSDISASKTTTQNVPKALSFKTEEIKPLRVDLLK